MSDINGVGIKSSEDVREAILLVRMSDEDFVAAMNAMAHRWGMDSALRMLFFAIYGDDSLAPLIKPTHELVDNFSKNGDPNDYYLKPLDIG